jgi:hypothetical protein
VSVALRRPSGLGLAAAGCSVDAPDSRGALMRDAIRTNGAGGRIGPIGTHLLTRTEYGQSWSAQLRACSTRCPRFG